MFFKVVNDQQIEYVHVIQIVVTDTGTFIKVDDDYPINDNFIPITQEEWDTLNQTVAEPEPEPVFDNESVEQKLERIEEQNIILMDALATTFEELIVLRELVEGGTK
jgi:hypothetical protein